MIEVALFFLAPPPPPPQAFGVVPPIFHCHCRQFMSTLSVYGSGDSAGWFQTRWLESCAEVDISSKELVPEMIAAAVSGKNGYLLQLRQHAYGCCGSSHK